MNEEVAIEKLLYRRLPVLYVGKHLENVKYKWFNKT